MRSGGAGSPRQPSSERGNACPDGRVARAANAPRIGSATLRRSACGVLLLIFLCHIAPASAQPEDRLLLVPLDNRPSTLLFTQQIARIGGANLDAPPRAILGDWLKPGDCEAVARWVLQQVPPQAAQATAFISSDMLCYGGLVGSRGAASSPLDALLRLNTLRELKRRGVALHVLATIPRLDLRTSAREAPYARALQIWAGSGDAAPPPGVPDDVLLEYLGVRRRNFGVLMGLLELLHLGVVDRLVVGQDDSTPRGLNMQDQERLLKAVAALGVGDRVTLMSGADELAMDMVAGWLAARSGYRPRLRVEYADAAAAEKVPPMESQPLDKTVADHIRLAGAEQVADGGPADAVLFIATRAEETVPSAETQQHRASLLAGRVMKLLQSGTPVGLADLQHLNRADPHLAYALIGEVPIWLLDAYAGWNTSSNAMGTAVAQCIAHRLAARVGYGWIPTRILESEKTHQAFLFARLVDDYGYQAVLRSVVAPEVAGLPVDPDRLLNLFGPVGMRIRADLIPWAERLFHDRFEGQTLYLPTLGSVVRLQRLAMEVVLPWQRIFEVEVRANLTLEPVRNDPGAER